MKNTLKLNCSPKVPLLAGKGSFSIDGFSKLYRMNLLSENNIGVSTSCPKYLKCSCLGWISNAKNEVPLPGRIPVSQDNSTRNDEKIQSNMVTPSMTFKPRWQKSKNPGFMKNYQSECKRVNLTQGMCSELGNSNIFLQKYFQIFPHYLVNSNVSLPLIKSSIKSVWARTSMGKHQLPIRKPSHQSKWWAIKRYRWVTVSRNKLTLSVCSISIK